MRVAVYGAGAVGGLVAARLARSGAPVSVVARGAALEAIRREGLRVRDRDGQWSARPVACGPAADLGPQDLVIVATKAHALTAAAPEMAPLLTDRTAVASAVNGIPWWYFHGAPPTGGSPHLDTVDPDGAIWNAIGPERALGCVVHLGAKSPEPGVVEHAYGLQLALGEPSGAASPRLEAAAKTLGEAGFKVRTGADIRVETWRKLYSNVAINPVSVIAGASCGRIAGDPALADLLAAMIAETSRVAAALGVEAPVDARETVRGFAAVGDFRTSMLQDLEAGRRLELGPILGAVVELAARLDIDVPRLREVHALARARSGDA